MSETTENIIIQRYEKTIAFYWASSKRNRNMYKTTRTCSIVLGALVTLIASLSAADNIVNNEVLNTILNFATPVFAAILAIVGGLSHGFQYGSAWHSMVVTAEHLQKQYDLFLVTPEDKRDYEKEAKVLNDYIIEETNGFFDRILGGSRGNVK